MSCPCIDAKIKTVQRTYLIVNSMDLCMVAGVNLLKS